jgi:hypothetical protein
MVYYRGTAVRRVVDAGAIDGFTCVTMMVDQDLPFRPSCDVLMRIDGIFFVFMNLIYFTLSLRWIRWQSGYHQ